ncbi:MAG: FeoB-associated Cys-rich membrane protein [Lachnospiraceae bacterium]|nr:FeoB-associated Cys-rich membrane protein [Lachnospiraceae bacterium]
MNLWNILLTVLIAAAVILAVVHCIRRRKRGGCGCGCDGCAAPCDARQSGTDAQE